MKRWANGGWCKDEGGYRIMGEVWRWKSESKKKVGERGNETMAA
jgi:hypothetical protein